MFGCPISEMLERISSREITEWIAEFKIRDSEIKKAQEQARLLRKAKGRL